MRVWGKETWGAAVWGATGLAETIEDYFDGDAWDRDDGLDDPIGGGGGEGGDGDTITLPVGDPDGEPVTITLHASKARPFPVEVHSVTGAKLAVCGLNSEGEAVGSSGFLGGTYRATLAEAGELTIKLAADDPSVAYLVYPNKIWVRDKFGLVLGRFIVRRVRKFRQGDARFVEVYCRDQLVQLAREVVIEYIATGTIKEHIATLFSGVTPSTWLEEDNGYPASTEIGPGQVQAYPISIGNIDAYIANTTVSLELAQPTTILGALNAMRDQLPSTRAGHFYINKAGAFCWKERIGPVGRRLQIGKNLRGVSYTTNDDELCTRLYMYGEGQDATDRLTLVDAGEANPYIESNVGTYGIVPVVKIDRRILKPETLLAYAQRYLEEFDTPQVEIDVDVLDLSQAAAPAGEDWSQWGDYYVGSKYLVEDSQQGISTEVTVHEVEYNLANPLPVRILSSRRRRGMQDVFRVLDERIPAPVNVNQGDRYSNISRIYTSGDDRADPQRDGDLKSYDDKLAYSQTNIDDQQRWADLVPSYTADTVGELPDDVPANSLGRVGGDTYERNAANDGWEQIKSPPLPVTTATSAETAEGHHHQGMPWVTVTNYADLPSATAGQIAYVSAERALYFRSVAADGITPGWWPIMAPMSYLSLPALPTVGARAIIYDDQVYIGMSGDSQWTRAQYVDDIT